MTTVGVFGYAGHGRGRDVDARWWDVLTGMMASVTPFTPTTIIFIGKPRMLGAMYIRRSGTKS